MGPHLTASVFIHVLLALILVDISFISKISKNEKLIDLDKIFLDEIGNQQLPDMSFSIGDDSSDSDSNSNSDVSREMEKYQKYLAKLNEKYYIEKFKKHLSDEEKQEMNYYEDLLQKIKKLHKVNLNHHTTSAPAASKKQGLFQPLA